MERRTLLALAISFIVLGFYPVILQKFYPDYYKNASHKIAAAHALPAGRQASPLPSAADGRGTVSRAPADLDAFDTTKDTPFRNENAQVLFNEKGTSIREIAFPKFIDSDTRKPLTILSLAVLEAAPTSVRLLDLGGKTGRDAGRYVPTEESVAVPARPAGGRGNEINVSSVAYEGRLKISKEYSYREKTYAADLRVRFENTSDSPLEFRYELFAGPSIPPRHAIDNQYIEANFFYSQNGKTSLRHIKESKLGKVVESPVPVDWVATKDRHFSIILKPKSSEPFAGRVEGLGSHRFEVSVLSGKIALASKASAEHSFLIYMGPNEIDELLPLGLDPIVNFGKMDVIGKVLVGGLELLNKIFKNYGVAIIALTTLINLMLFPLTRLSYMSMKRMQLIQPQMTKLREQHKKNPEKLNKEMMELYKKHKVNPFGGCLPMVLQMPVFIALYVALSKSVILINSKLFWIKDLSSPDGIPLPVSLPFFGKEIHLLPLVMVAAMFVQQKFTQIKMEGQDPQMEDQQKMMAVMMPVLFGFIFYGMPSGLVLYWLTNTLLMTFYQWRLKQVTLT